MDHALVAALRQASARGLFAFEPVSAETPASAAPVVRPPTKTLAGLERGQSLAWRSALRITLKLATALEELEARGWPAGQLGPEDVALEPVVALMAHRTLDALLGRSKPPPAIDLRWSPPEVGEGQPWDAAASRYFVGLVAYRLIAGELPSGAAGLRAELASRAEFGVTPFDAQLAAQLSAGVETTILSWIGRASGRPATASELAASCNALLRGSVGEPSAPSAARAHVMPAPSAATPRTTTRWLLLVPLFAATLASGLAVAWPKQTTADIPVRDTSLDLEVLSPDSCAPCHAREVVEWRRSVMSQAARSPLFGALESVVEEQVGNDAACPGGAGVLRSVEGIACTEARTGLSKSGSGGESWCVNCHAPGANVVGAQTPWNATGAQRGRSPLRDVLPPSAMQGVSCVACHRVSGPVALHQSNRGEYEGNATWKSFVTGLEYGSRPEDGQGERGIANSGYAMSQALLAPATPAFGRLSPHSQPPAAARDYLRSSAFCGACHDVRLFGTDTLGSERGEHFKRLRNAYSEWRTWSDSESRQGREAATCQGCHMSRYPGVCVPSAITGASDPDCPPGSRFEARAPSDAPEARTHYFTSVDLPLAPEFPEAFVSDRTLDASGTPLGLRARRNILLKRTFRFGLGEVIREGSRLSIPVQLENIGAGHRVPAGFSQEREIWVELRVRDGRGATVYEVGALSSDDEDLRDKSFETISVDDETRDSKGRPIGVFGADVTDGPDAPAWSPESSSAGSAFRGRGLVNLQNGFLRCVRCIGRVGAGGKCEADEGQQRLRSARFEDGDYDFDTGACGSNLTGENALFETYFPVGSLDARRGIAKAPDAIIDTRSAPPGVPVTYRYELDVGAHPSPLTITARLRFRAFPPYLVRAFADYEALAAARGRRPSGPQVTRAMLSRIDVVELAAAEATVR